MEKEKALFESKGGNPWLLLICCVAFAAFVSGITYMFSIEAIGNHESFYGATVIIMSGLAMFLLNFIMIIIKSELKIFENHIEFKGITPVNSLDGFTNLPSRKLIYAEIVNVSVNPTRSYLVFKSKDTEYIVFCHDVKRAAKVLNSRLIKSKN